MKYLRFENLGARVGSDRSKDHDVVNPDWTAVENAIRSLDGKDRSYVMLSADENSLGDHLLTVGGGQGGAYVCFYYDGDEYNLIDPDCVEDGTVEVLLGEPSIRQKKELVHLKSALDAARSYYDRGIRNPHLTWVLQEL